MQWPLEDRVASVETAAERQEMSIARIDAMLADHDQLPDRVAAVEVELARDAAITRLLWHRLAQQFGWLDNEQNGALPESPA